MISLFDLAGLGGECSCIVWDELCSLVLLKVDYMALHCYIIKVKL